MINDRGSLGTLLRHLIELLDNDVQAIYAARGLDYRPRFTPIMRALMAQTPLSIRAIAQYAAITHSAASQSVREMARAGLVASSASTRDARERAVALTPKALAMADELQQCWTATQSAVQQLGAELDMDIESEIARIIAAPEEKPFRVRIEGG